VSWLIPRSSEQSLQQNRGADQARNASAPTYLLNLFTAKQANQLSPCGLLQTTPPLRFSNSFKGFARAHKDVLEGLGHISSLLLRQGGSNLYTLKLMRRQTNELSAKSCTPPLKKCGRRMSLARIRSNKIALLGLRAVVLQTSFHGTGNIRRSRHFDDVEPRRYAGEPELASSRVH
jgi:hypothetical protein